MHRFSQFWTGTKKTRSKTIRQRRAALIPRRDWAKRKRKLDDRLTRLRPLCPSCEQCVLARSRRRKPRDASVSETPNRAAVERLKRRRPSARIPAGSRERAKKGSVRPFLLSLASFTTTGRAVRIVYGRVLLLLFFLSVYRRSVSFSAARPRLAFHLSLFGPRFSRRPSERESSLEKALTSLRGARGGPISHRYGRPAAHLCISTLPLARLGRVLVSLSRPLACVPHYVRWTSE